MKKRERFLELATAPRSGLTEEQAEKAWFIAQAVNHLETKRLGFAGLSKEGTLVDRRLDPTATPTAENDLLSIPKPKPIFAVDVEGAKIAVNVMEKALFGHVENPQRRRKLKLLLTDAFIECSKEIGKLNTETEQENQQ